MHSLCDRYYWRLKETFCLFLTEDRFAGPHIWQPYALPIVLTCHFACYIIICLHLSCSTFSNTFVSILDKLYCLFIIIVFSLRVCSVAFSCFSVSFLTDLPSYVSISLLNTSVHLNVLSFTVSSVYVLLNDFLLLIQNWLICNQFGMHSLCDRYYWRLTDCFYLLLPRIDS